MNKSERASRRVTGLWWSIIVLLSLFLAAGTACKKKGEHPPQASKPHSPSQVAKSQPPPAPAVRKKSPHTYKGYTLEIEEAVKKGKVLTVKVRIANMTSKKIFRKAKVTLGQYDSQDTLLSSLYRTIDVTALRPGSSREITLEFTNPHPRVIDVEAKITGLR